MTRVGGDSGSGSILVVAIVAAMLCLTAMAVPLYTVLAGKRVVSGAADAAALAAADVAVGRAPGIPCELAARVAEANGSELHACRADGLVVTVRVGIAIAGFTVAATATAGPPLTHR